ncbi:hypothetical protein KCV01_g26390, partial [Aureobasidium melanogenum]
LGTTATPETLAGYDTVLLATGVLPRGLAIEGANHPKVLSYLDVLHGDKPVGHKVAVIGAGGIGFDVAEFLTEAAPSPTTDVTRWSREWGVDMTMATPGGLMPAQPEKPDRQVWLLQRTAGRPGARLNKTSGWVHRATLKNKKVQMFGGVTYERIDDDGLHVSIDGEVHVLPVDNVVVCAGQEPNRELHDALAGRGIDVRLIGGADVAAELDAKRAIDQATRLAASL